MPGQIGDNVYIYYGHGYDVCKQNSDKLAITTVPENSYYVSKSACGIVSTLDGYYQNLYVDASGSLVNPEDPIHKKLLEKKLDSELEIHKPGDEIVDSYYYSLGFYPPYKNKGDEFVIAFSGLRHYSANKKYVRKNFGFKKYKLTDLVPKKVLLESYEGAIFPDKETVQRLVTKDFYSYDDLKKLSQNNELNILVRHLILWHKGIHYMLLCRNTSEFCKKAAFKRRLYSAEKHGTHWNTMKRLLRFANDDQNVKNHIAALKKKKKVLQIPNEEVENVYLKIRPDRWKFINALRWKAIRNVTGKNKKVEKPNGCPPGQVRNSVTKKCRERRKPGPKSNNATRKAKANAKAKACPPGQVRNSVTKKCRDKRKPGPKEKGKVNGWVV